MILARAFETFVAGSPVCVMIRGSLEYALSESFVNQLFEQTAKRQYTRELLFSEVVDVMSSVVCQVFPSVSAAYKKQQQGFSVSRRALYDKINLVESCVVRELVVQTSQRLRPVVQALRKRASLPDLLPGFPVRILDGNHLAATEHRIKELRHIAAGPLPGQALVVLDPDRRLITDVFPCEDAHAQERSQLIDVLDAMEAGQVWIADRNFCTALFLFQTAANQAYFLVRQHATNVRWEPVGESRKAGRTDTGIVYQQRVELIDDWGNRLSARRITIRLDQPTEDGDTEIHLLTNLPKRVAAKRIAVAYRGRWKLESAFRRIGHRFALRNQRLGLSTSGLVCLRDWPDGVQHPECRAHRVGRGSRRGVLERDLRLLRDGRDSRHDARDDGGDSATPLATAIWRSGSAFNGKASGGAGRKGQPEVLPKISPRSQTTAAQANVSKRSPSCFHRPHPCRAKGLLVMTASQT